MSEEIYISEGAFRTANEIFNRVDSVTYYDRLNKDSEREERDWMANQIQLLLNQRIQLACLNWRHRDALLQTKIAALEAALDGILTRYLNLVMSGDCGSWNPEKEAEVIAARLALNSTKGEKPKDAKGGV